MMIVLSIAAVYLYWWHGPSLLSNWLVELTLLGIGLVGLYAGGILRKAQAMNRLALVEVVVIGVFLAVTTAISGTNAGGPALPSVALASLIIIAVSEETNARGYFMGEIQEAWKSRVGSGIALVGSAGYFAFLHFPKYVNTSTSSADIANGLVLTFGSGAILGLIYLLSKHNLLLVVSLHFYFDAYGVFLRGPFPFIQNWSVLIAFVIPLMIIVGLHGVGDVGKTGPDLSTDQVAAST